MFQELHWPWEQEKEESWSRKGKPGTLFILLNDLSHVRLRFKIQTLKKKRPKKFLYSKLNLSINIHNVKHVAHPTCTGAPDLVGEGVADRQEPQCAEWQGPWEAGLPQHRLPCLTHELRWLSSPVQPLFIKMMLQRLLLSFSSKRCEIKRWKPAKTCKTLIDSEFSNSVCFEKAYGSKSLHLHWVGVPMKNPGLYLLMTGP